MRVPSFGNNGAVDLKADDDQKIEPDLTTGEIGWQSAPTVVGDKVLIGSAFREGFTPTSYKNNKGSARAYDVRTGKKIWEFHTIPQKGEPGAETWLDNSNVYTGNTGVWTEMTADPVAGLAYHPGRAADLGLLWRQASRQRPLWRQPGRGGSQYRQGEMVFPAHPS